MRKLADALQTTVDYILQRTDNPNPWQTIDDVVVDLDLARKMKDIGATVIKKTDELLKSGMTHEQLEKLLQMMIDLQNEK